jgi:hypothetical protein
VHARLVTPAKLYMACGSVPLSWHMRLRD